MKKLNTPTKRIGAIFVIIGVLFMLTASVIRTYKYATFWNPYSQPPKAYQYILIWLDKLTDSLITSLSLHTWSSDFSILMLTGFCLFIVGMLMSYLYDVTIGRVIKWIKTGSS